MRATRLPATALVAGIVVAAGALTGCGGGGARSTGAPPTAGSRAPVSSVAGNPLGGAEAAATPAAASGALPYPTLPPDELDTSPSIPPAPTSPPPIPVFSPRSLPPASSGDKAQVNAVYNRFLYDISGLYATDDHVWAKDMRLVATPTVINAAVVAADEVKRAGDRAVGTVRDSHRAVDVQGDRAAAVSCLDEVSWYVVTGAFNMPDPAVTRDYYATFASFERVNGSWVVAAWKPGTHTCTF